MYINSGKFSDKLKAVKAVGAGFIDGDINIVFRGE